ncbi:MAG: peptidylprolyl isomerase [Clostridia bacterium]|nr:peptidylprolyl isomerase [Clostridia bacterium]
MSQKKKNSNYVTEKTVKAKEERREADAATRKQKMTRIIVIASVSVVLAALLIVGICWISGAFDYHPVATAHVTIEIEGYGSLHVELYGNDAPETVKKFTSLANSGKFNGMEFHTFYEGLLYGGSTIADGGTNGIKGEFSENGVVNKISHKRGIISLSRGEKFNTGYDQFFIVTEDSPMLDGKYAAFGMVTSGMDVIDKIIEDSEIGENGYIPYGKRPVITSISSHEAHH